MVDEISELEAKARKALYGPSPQGWGLPAPASEIELSEAHAAFNTICAKARNSQHDRQQMTHLLRLKNAGDIIIAELEKLLGEIKTPKNSKRIGQTLDWMKTTREGVRDSAQAVAQSTTGQDTAQ